MLGQPAPDHRRAEPGHQRGEPPGEKGKGGMAASDLGPSRKGHPCWNDLQPGETAVLAEIEGPGVIQHMWFTVTDKTSDADCFVLRDLVLRIYWDEERKPSVEVPFGDFFCCGFGQACQVNSLPIAVNPTRGFNCYFPMPSARGPRSRWRTSTKTPSRRCSTRSITACRKCRRTPGTSTPSGGGRG